MNFFKCDFKKSLTPIYGTGNLVWKDFTADVKFGCGAGEVYKRFPPAGQRLGGYSKQRKQFIQKE
jgi:hypothetical protein